MKKVLLALSFVLGTYSFLVGQDLNIYLDVPTQQITYKKKGKIKKKAKVRKGQNVYLHVTNYNNYIYKVNVTQSFEEVTVSDNVDFNSLVSGGLGMGFGGFGAGSPGGFLSPVPTGSGDELDGLDGEGGGGRRSGFAGEEAAVSEKFKALKQKLEFVLSEMELIEEDFNKINEEVDNIVSKQELIEIGLQEINRIKFDPNFNPSQIKKLTNDYFTRIFNDRPTDQVDLGFVLNEKDPSKSLLKQLDRIKRKEAEYQKYTSQLLSINEEINGLDPTSFSSRMLMSSGNNAVNNGEEVISTVNRNKDQILNWIVNAEGTQLSTLTRLWYEYEDVASNTFTHTHRTEADGELMVFDVDLKLSDTTIAERTRADKTIEFAPVKVNVGGRLRINASAGLTFGQFFQRPLNYFVRDTTIVSEEDDAFFPALTTFIHFYRQSASNLSIGGSFGVGFALTDSDNIKSPSFYLGPSFIIGKGERLVLSGGIVGARVRQLTNGFEVGDTVDFFQEFDTKHSYELGYFIGLSFNLLPSVN